MADKIDFKKVDKELYYPKTSPALVNVPQMKFVTMSGRGGPNDPSGEYFAAIKAVYSISYVIRFDKSNIEGYLSYTIPPLEILWCMEDGFNFSGAIDKNRCSWKIMLRQPDFVDENAFDRACKVIQKRKKIKANNARLENITEGLCVQCMHIGAYNDESATNDKLLKYIDENGYIADFGTNRTYHEIYINSPQKTNSVNVKTVIRYPIREVGIDTDGVK